MYFLGIKPLTSTWVQTLKTSFFLNFASILVLSFPFLAWKTLKKQILTSVLRVQLLKTGRNIQHTPKACLKKLFKLFITNFGYKNNKHCLGIHHINKEMNYHNTAEKTKTWVKMPEKIR